MISIQTYINEKHEKIIITKCALHFETFKMGTKYWVEELTLDFEANYILKNKQVQEKKVCCLPSLLFCQVETHHVFCHFMGLPIPFLQII